MEKKIEKSLKQLESVNQWISNCDTKSSFLLTFYGVIITIIFSSDILEDILKTLLMNRAEKIKSENITLFFSFCILLFFLFSIAKTIFHIFNTLKARIDTKVYKQENLNTNSKLFFGTIAKRTFKNFEIENNMQDDESYLNDLNSQIFINSTISSKKFEHYNRSLRWIIVSFFTFLVYVLTK